MLLLTEIDNPDGVFVGQWSDEDTVARIFDGDVYVRLRRITSVSPTMMDAELILAHDGQLMPITRTQNTATWAEDLRTPAAAIMTLHADLESRLECRAYAEGAATPD